jgi:hypothetical protein
MPNFCVMASTRAWLLSLLVSTVASLGCSAGSDTDSPDRPPSDATGAGGDSGGGDAGGGGGGGAGGANGCEAAFGAGVGEGTAADDEALDVAVDASGNVYVTGYEGGLTGVTNVQPTGDARAFVAKYSASGELQWRTELDTPGTDTGEGIAIDPMSGDVYVAGRTTGVLAGTTNQGKFDLFLAVLSAQGEIRAVHQTGRERPEHPVRLGLVDGGRVVIAGYDDLYVPTNHVESVDDGFVLRLDVDLSASTPVVERGWTRADSEIDDRLTGVAVAADGSAYVTGFENGGGAFLEKLDPDGARVWIRTDDDLGANPSTVALSPVGSVVFAGSIFVSGSGFSVVVGEVDAASGGLLRSAAVPTDDFTVATGVGVDAAGDIWVGGHTLGSIEPGVDNAGGMDVFSLRVHDGSIASIRQAGTAGDDLASSIAVDACGRGFLGGFTQGSLIGGSENAGKRDVFVMPLHP